MIDVNKQIIFYTTKQDKFKANAFEYGDNERIQAYIEENKENDTYKSINLYKEATSWKKSNIAALIFLVIDVEVVGHAFDITKEDASMIVEKMQKDFNNSIPTPSAINHSGRGLHIYFNIMPTTDIFKYQTVLKRLQKLTDKLIGQYYALAEAKHDPHVNYHSLIRVEGTQNTIAGVKATNLFYSKKCYELDYIIENYIPDLKNTIGNSDKAQRKTLARHQKDFKTFKRAFKGYRKGFTEKTLQEAVLNDFNQLQQLRASNVIYTNGTYKNIGTEGYRNVMLWYYAVYAKYYYKDTSKAYEAVQAFNKNYKPQPLEQREVNEIFYSALKANYTTAKLTTIANALELTADEMKQMSVIFNQEEKRKRNVRKNAKSRQKKTLQRLDEKKENIQHAKTLYEQGLSYREVARVLNVSLGTAHNYINK